MAEYNHEEFVRGISKEDKILVELRDEIYLGSWGRMLEDLKDRLQTRPYISKIIDRIEEDLVRMERLQAYELKHRVNLADLIRQTN